jgi:sigma-B regulation protein RsbU (phosphoserine phosphatase)
MPAVLVSAVSPPADLRGLIADSGFAVVDHALGSVPPVDFGPVSVAVLDVGTKPDAATLQTRRWRAELADNLVPIVWLLPAPDARLAARGLDAGADAVLERHAEAAVLVAQLRSAARARLSAARVAARADESRMLGEHLRKAHALIDRELAIARGVRLASLQRSFPERGAVRFAVSHRPRGRTGGDFYRVAATDPDRLAFHLGDVVGPGAAGGLLGNFAAQIATASAESAPARSPGDVLAGVNRELLRLGLDEPPLVAMLAGVVETRSGEIAVARAGLPAPVFVPAGGEPEAWAVPGPFLGTGDASYPVRTALLRTGDKLVVGTDGIRPDGDPNPSGVDPLLEVAARHRDLTGQGFADAVARDLLTGVRHEDDFTLLVVEMAVETRPR